MAPLADKFGKTIVLTGGPCAGKTTIAYVLGRAFSDRALVLPESASMLMRGGFPRWQGEAARRALQTAIFRVQVELERLYRHHHPGSLLLLDRGTIDGAAYWPEGPDAFFSVLGTSERAELGRYDKVIYLESADSEEYARSCSSNPTRNESYAEAKALDVLTRGIWARHPNLTVVPAAKSFVDKVARVVEIIVTELEGAPAVRLAQSP